MEGVNALAKDVSLEFSETGMTVVYGLNGAGKSSFMRIFKKLSGNPYEEPIQPNVFDKSLSVKPSCKVSIKKDGYENTISCDLSNKSNRHPLSHCDVFDTRISNAYITSTNNVSYQPFVFTVLSKLSQVADKIGEKIKSFISSITNTVINLPEEFSDCKAIAWIKNMKAESVIPADFIEWTADQQAQLERLSRLLDKENIQEKLQLLNTQKLSVDPILQDLIAAMKLMQNGSLREAYELFCSCRGKARAAELLFTEQADDLDKNSVNVEDWRALWRIAKSYYESSMYPNSKKHFGAEETICPLCHQKICDNTLKRFQSINDYINGTCNEEFRRSSDGLKRILTDVITRAYSLSQVEKLISAIFNEKECETIKSAFRSIESVKSISDIEEAYLNLIKVDLNPAIKLISEKLKTIEKEIQLLNNSLNDQMFAQHQEKFHDLKYHKWVFENQSNIKSVILNLEHLKELNNTKSYWMTNKITSEANALADILITQEYIRRFTAELSNLTP